MSPPIYPVKYLDEFDNQADGFLIERLCAWRVHLKYGRHSAFGADEGSALKHPERFLILTGRQGR